MEGSFLTGERRLTVLVKPSLEEDSNESSGKTPDGVTSPGESKVNPETCKNKVLARGYDLDEVMIDIDNHEQS
jgi:hypothetical protein